VTAFRWQPPRQRRSTTCCPRSGWGYRHPAEETADVDPEDIRDLVRVLDSSSLEEFKVDMGGLSVTLRRHGARGDWTRESHVTRQPHVLEASQESDTREAAGRRRCRPGRAPPPRAPVERTSTRSPLLCWGRSTALPSPCCALRGSWCGRRGGHCGRDDGDHEDDEPVHAGVTGIIVEICVGDAEFAQPETALMLVEVRS